MRVDVYEIKEVQIQTKTSKAGKPYQVAHVTYRDTMGKLAERDVMPFGSQKAAFDTLQTITPGTYSVEVIKNDAGYLEWIKVNQGGDAPSMQANQQKVAATPAPKSTYETPEERAMKQKYIVRQSSITNAIALFELDKKRIPTIQDVLHTAKAFEDYVFGHAVVDQNTAGDIAEMSDDIPL